MLQENQKTIIVLKPQYIPIRCPICKGFGTVNFGKIQCKACQGLGYLKVPPKEDDREENGK